PFGNRLIKTPGDENLYTQTASGTFRSWPKIMGRGVAQWSTCRDSADVRRQCAIIFQNFSKRIQGRTPFPERFQYPELIPDVIEDMARVGVGFDGKMVPVRQCVELVRLFFVARRVRVAKDVQPHALPNTAEEFNSTSLRLLPARAADEVIDGVVKERVLIT